MLLGVGRCGVERASNSWLVLPAFLQAFFFVVVKRPNLTCSLLFRFCRLLRQRSTAETTKSVTGTTPPPPPPPLRVLTPPRAPCFFHLFSGLFLTRSTTDMELAELVLLVGLDWSVLLLHQRLLAVRGMGLPFLLRRLPDDEPPHLLARAHSGTVVPRGPAALPGALRIVLFVG